MTSDKKKLLSKPQTLKIIYPAGFRDIALLEIKNILNDLWLAKSFKGDILLLKNEIRIKRIYLYAATELLLRNKSLTDMRLVIFHERVVGLKAFEKACRQMDWSLYFDKKMKIKIKVNSVASQAFHEKAIKEIMATVLSENIVNDDEDTYLFIEFYKDKLMISLSLAGNPLYKRGYRDILATSAPLREDIASACILKAFHFAKIKDFPKNIFIPFSGTGTLAFEFLLYRFQCVAKRDFAIQLMPFYKKEYRENILNFYKKNRMKHDVTIYCADTDHKAIEALETNIKLFHQVFEITNAIHSLNTNFFDMDIQTLFSNKAIFMPLNPPYGLRKSSKISPEIFYKNIAKKINEMKKTNHVLGFILCPSENTWSVFCQTLQEANIQTYHFTQGGLDIRVCQFCLSSS